MLKRTVSRYSNLVVLFVLFLGCLNITGASAAVSDFTFIHISDEHANSEAKTADTIKDLAALSSVELSPYGVKAVPPAFVIETGDMTEFGPKNGAWDTLDSYYSCTSLPRYRSLGNHDGTWRSLSPELTKLYGAPYYSFDKSGCHFVILDSAGLQSPRPVLSPQELDWLRADLKSVAKDTPIFVGMHHPIDCSEFSSRYEVDRLLDILRPYNVALLMVGHGHSARYTKFDGVDMVEGGSAWGPGAPGYQVVSVLNGVLRVAFKETGKPAADLPMIEKPLSAPIIPYPVITIDSPADRLSCSETIPVKARIDLGQDKIKKAGVEIDGVWNTDLKSSDDATFGADIATKGMTPGAHWMKICFEDANGSVYHRSTCFYVDSPGSKVRWRTYLGSSVRSTPVVSGDTVFAGLDSGWLRAYSTDTGQMKWEFKAGGAVAGPLVVGETVCFGSEDGYVYCVSASTGELLWRFKAGDPVYSCPASDGVAVYFGSGRGTFYGVSAADGKLNWKNTDASYNIQSQPFISGGRVYYGCWDMYVYCLDTADGHLVWKCKGQGSSEGTAPAYYSPANCTPVVCGNRVFAADRKYRLSIIDAVTGKQEKFLNDVSAVGLSADGSHVYLRKTNGMLTKVDS
ncbi:MAG TPA: PQQ-binding-like beta-propeller repeat protein, partial [Armatimonadota bacterium]